MTDLKKAMAQLDEGQQFETATDGLEHHASFAIAQAVGTDGFLSAESWKAAIKTTEGEFSRHLKDSQRTSEENKQNHKRLAKEKRLQKEFFKRILYRVSAIDRQPEPLQSESFRHLYNQMNHYVEIAGEVPLAVIKAPDLNQRSSLQTASSEPVVLNLESALERGRFQRNQYTDNPMADISGRTGREHIKASAELGGYTGESDPDRQATLDKIVQRLSDPAQGFGPKVAQMAQVLMNIWLERRDRSNAVTVTIGILAEALGYIKGEHGHHPDTYEKVREYVDILRRVNLQSESQIINKNKGRGSPTVTVKMEGMGYNFTFFNDAELSGRASKGWTAIRYSMGEVIKAFAARDEAMLMGRDLELNKLNPRNERWEVLLGKYCENQWRFNWNIAPGSITRSVQTLLTAGAGLSEAEADRPAIKTLDRLDEALEKLRELGTVRSFTFDETVTVVREHLQQNNGRMTRSQWAAVLASMVTVESGKQYNQHYQNHGLTYTGNRKGRVELQPIIVETLQLLQTTNKAQATLAAEIGISAGTLSRYLAGKSKPPAQLIERLELALANERQQQLPLA